MESFNTIIIGGGIVGSGMFRDLSLHNISTLMIDKGDFSAKTSQSSSKMLHGGIRYLENYDFELVQEALHEKNLWLKIAPHLCYEQRFYLPIYNNSKRPLWMVKIGLFLYDFLSGFKNSPHETINKNQTLERIPGLNEENLVGAGAYSDAIVDDAKMTLELIYDGLNSATSKALNYHEFLSETKVDNHHIVKIKNVLNGEIKTYKAKNIVFALGPYTDQVLSKQVSFKWSPVLLPSKGSHIWISQKRLPLRRPLVMMTNENRVIFVIPQNDLVLVGTTEIKVNENYDLIKISDNEIDYLLSMLNSYFPNSFISKKDVIGSYAGIRPLVKEDGDNLGKTSREHKIYRPYSSAYVIAGGKYTTFRIMGQEITKSIVLKEHKTYQEYLSMIPLRNKSTILSFTNKTPTNDDLINILENELPKTFEDLVKRRIGVNSKKIWNEFHQLDFDQYFLSKYDLINKYIAITKDEILNFN